MKLLLKKIWIDPVWSKVIAAGIITSLAALATAIYNILAPRLLEFGIIQVKSRIVIIAAVLFFLIASFFLLKYLVNRRRKIIIVEIEKMAKEYSTKSSFYSLFSNQDSGNIVFSRIGHQIEVQTLVEKMESEGLILKTTENYPTLSKLGMEVREFAKKNRLGLFEVD